MPFNILYIIKFRCQRVLHIDYNDFPVCLTLVEKSHYAQDLDLFDLTNITYLFPYFTNIKGVVITLRFCLYMGLCRILPSLSISRRRSHESISITSK